MASQSLYRKWRSQTFSDLVGQDSVVRTLKNALNSGTLAHAYLFTGPRGTGKTSMARLLAKTINCLNPQDGEPCNVCEQCREITIGSSFNVIEIDAASNRGIDSIRELRDKVMMPPVGGKYKVYILDEAHMLTTEAFNALLKTLEEPPPHAIFVMATTDVHKMLPTVLSRCQRFDFRRFTLRQLVDRLNYIASEEHVELERGAAELLARAASGGMRDAVSLLDQAIAYSGHVVSLSQVQTMLGVADPRAIQKLILYIAQLSSPDGLHLLHELTESGADLRQLNTQLAEYFRAMMLARAGADIAEILDGTADEINEIQQASQAFALEELIECARIFAQNDLMQKNLGTPQLGLELALLASVELHRRGSASGTVARSAPSVAPAQSARAFEAPARQPVAPPPTAPHREPSVPAPSPTVMHRESPVSAPSVHMQAPTPISPPPVHLEAFVTPLAHVEQPAPPATSVSPNEREDDDVEEEVVDEALPEWDTLSYAEGEDEVDEELPVAASAPAPLPSRTVEPPQAAASAPLVSPASSYVPESSHRAEPVVAQVSAEQVPVLTVQDVREKWEYIKRRVRSKSAKDGSLVQALLNDYTILAIEGTREQPVVVLRAGAEFHFKQLQNNDERRRIIEWAMKVELQQECRVKLVSPSHVGPSMTIPPPSSDGGSGSSLFSSMLAMPRSSAFQERPVAEKPLSARSYPASQSEAVAPPAVVPAPAQDVQKLASAPQARPVSSPPAVPLARTHVVRENTTGGTMRAEESRVTHQTRVEQHAKGDPVVQEVLRLFKAEIKEIRSK